MSFSPSVIAERCKGRRPLGPLVGRPRDLATPAELCRRNGHKHGTKMRYMTGCRCSRCRRGNARNEARMERDRKLYGPNDLVSSARVLAHLRYLQQFGLGHKTVGKLARVSKTSLARIIWPFPKGGTTRQHIRRRSEARVLAIQPSLDTLPRCVNVPAGPTLDQIRQLMVWGYPKSLITRDALGNKSVGLQVHSLKGKTAYTTVRTAVAIRDFFALIESMRALWTAKRGPIPARLYVYFRAAQVPGKGSLGNKLKRPVTIKQLDLRPFASTYDYTVLWPKELKEVSSLKNKVRKLVKSKEKENAGKRESA